MSKQKYFYVDLWQYPRFSLIYIQIYIIFGGHFDFFIKSVAAFLFQYSEHIHYYDYVETRVSNLKFIKDYDIGPEMT